MTQQLQMDTTIEVVGRITGVSFKNEENGFVICTVVPEADFSEIKATGILPEAKEGLDVRLRGYWKIHPRYGKQFEFSVYDVPDPTSEGATVAYLSTLKGCGPAIAQRIWDLFGPEAIAILESAHERLLEVSGIGPKTLPKIKESFETTRALRHLIGFLGDLGVGASYATRIYNTYGDGAIAKIRQDPYILAEEVRGFGFKKADELARNLGIGNDSIVRVMAASLHVLKEAAGQQGHCFLPQGKLITAAAEALTLPGFRVQSNLVETALAQMVLERQVYRHEDNYWLPDLWAAEEALAKGIKALAGEIPLGTIYQGKDRRISLDEFLADFCDRNHPLHPLQEQAVRVAATQGFSILTGGPGTGKSSTSRAIIELWHAMQKRVVLAAPSGKAAKRLKEATGYQAQTIHRLLGWQGRRFMHDRHNPLEGDAFLIDEASMVNLKLFEALITAIPRNAVVAIVGDINQLPAIGAGAVLKDLIGVGTLPVTRLTHIYRQGENSTIALHCRAVEQGEVPLLERMTKTDEPRQDCVFLQVKREHIPRAIEWLLAERLPQLGHDPADIQILGPMKKGEYGCEAFNTIAQKIWNPPQGRKTAEIKGLREGDRVIQLRNDYDKQIYNGDMGTVLAVDKEEQELETLFDDVGTMHVVTHQFREAGDLALANALTIHKSQGSEFPVVILPVTMSHYIMLYRNLLYTAMSRAKKLLILVGEIDAIRHAVRTVQADKRNTMLQERLQA